MNDDVLALARAELERLERRRARREQERAEREQAYLEALAKNPANAGQGGSKVHNRGLGGSS